MVDVRQPTIFAIGTASPENRAINAFIASLCGAEKPEICFIGTASGEPPEYFQRVKEGFLGLAKEVRELSFFRPPTADLAGYLGEFDAVYVGGGNTKSLLALWREWGVDKVLFDLWRSGTVLTGVSAGCICWFQHGVTDSIPGPLTPLPCLGFLPEICCPHFGDEPARRPTFHEMIRTGVFPVGIGVDANCGLLYRDNELAEVVSSDPESKAYRVEKSNEGTVEIPIPVTLHLPVIS